MVETRYSIDELLNTRFSSTAHITNYNYDALVATMNDDLAVWNKQMTEMLAAFCDMSNKQMVNAGSSEESGDFVPLDEVGKAGSGIVLPGQTLGWPLRRFGKGINVTRFWAEMATPYDLLMRQKDVEIQHRQRVISEIRKGIFYNVNYSFVDRFFDGITIPVKGFYNSDASWKIPMGPDGTTFTSSTHNHYNATAALAASDVDALVNDVAEHQSNADGIEIYIPLTSKAAFTALTGFQKVQPVQFYQNIDVTTNVVAGNLDNSAPLGDQYIGLWDSGNSPVCKVYVKPFCLSGYLIAVSTTADQKPLMYRIHPNTNLSGLRLWAKTSDGSLFNDQYEWLGGFAPFNRSALAVLYTGGAVYSSPFTAAQLEQ